MDKLVTVLQVFCTHIWGKCLFTVNTPIYLFIHVGDTTKFTLAGAGRGVFWALSLKRTMSTQNKSWLATDINTVYCGHKLCLLQINVSVLTVHVLNMLTITSEMYGLQIKSTVNLSCASWNVWFSWYPLPGDDTGCGVWPVRWLRNAWYRLRILESPINTKWLCRPQNAK